MTRGRRNAKVLAVAQFVRLLWHRGSLLGFGKLLLVGCRGDQVTLFRRTMVCYLMSDFGEE